MYFWKFVVTCFMLHHLLNFINVLCALKHCVSLSGLGQCSENMLVQNFKQCCGEFPLLTAVRLLSLSVMGAAHQRLGVSSGFMFRGWHCVLTSFKSTWFLGTSLCLRCNEPLCPGRLLALRCILSDMVRATSVFGCCFFTYFSLNPCGLQLTVIFLIQYEHPCLLIGIFSLFKLFIHQIYFTFYLLFHTLCLPFLCYFPCFLAF